MYKLNDGKDGMMVLLVRMIDEDDDGDDCEDDAPLMMLLKGFIVEDGKWRC